VNVKCVVTIVWFYGELRLIDTY